MISSADILYLQKEVNLVKQSKNLELVKLLSPQIFISSEEIATSLKISSRTVRNKLKELNDLLLENGAEIEFKPRHGVRLVIKNKDFFKTFLHKSSCTENKIPNSQEERVQYLLEYLLIKDEYVKLEDLCEQLHISNSTITNDLKIVKERLRKYNLVVEAKAKHGIKIKGNEFDLRLCITNNTSDRLLEQAGYKTNDNSKKEIEKVASILNKVFEENAFKIYDYAYQNLITHLFIAIKRLQNEELILLEDTQITTLKTDYPNEYKLAQLIAKEIKDIFDLTLPEVEIGYISIHLASKKIIEMNYSQSENLVITDDINQIVKKMLLTIYDFFKVDFRDDLELRMALAAHLIPLKVRLSYDLSVKNPLLKDIKTRFTLAYTIAVQACDLLKEAFSKGVTEDEIAYFALHFNLALERKKKKIELKNILIVCSSGKGSSALLVYRFKSEFGNYLNQIDTSELYQLKKVDFTQYDYVIATVPIPFQIPIPIPILEVKYFLEDEDLQAIKSLFHREQANSLMKYYDERLFLVDVDLQTKEEVLKFMVDNIRKVKEIPETFYASVIKREQQAVTEFGNLVAIPHPDRAISKDTFVCIAILKKPIIWEKRKVHFVYLMSIENNVNKNLQLFYKVTSRLLINETHIRNIIKKKDFHFMLEMIQLMEKEIGE